MTIDAQTALRRSTVRLWLYACAALIFLTVLVGGATRLTGSGLSITEWQPVTGILPPFTEAAWNAEFEKYRTIPQYREINRGMSLAAFKTIYLWEWTHRILGRLIGAAFLLPFLWFLWRGWIEPRFRTPLWVIFGLGAVQGAVGWWMVKSGLAVRVSVAHERLAFHLTLACVIYAAIIWTALRMTTSPPRIVPALVRLTAMVLLALVLIQIFVGALVAGLHGGLIYNNWPMMDGGFWPLKERLMFLRPIWINFFDNILTVQFEHRMIAYALWFLSMLHFVDVVMRRAEAAVNGALALAVAVTIQAVIGILTLLFQAPLQLALLHQGMAIVVLTIAVVHAAQLTGQKRELPSAALPSAPSP
jgi:heme a synthase